MLLYRIHIEAYALIVNFLKCSRLRDQWSRRHCGREPIPIRAPILEDFRNLWIAPRSNCQFTKHRQLFRCVPHSQAEVFELPAQFLKRILICSLLTGAVPLSLQPGNRRKTSRSVISGSRLFNTVFSLPRHEENIARSLGTFQSGPPPGLATISQR
jgi:hypothetical protein